jgi:alkylation response protein AidB-like acyl-CoA dehydrogenase
VAELDLSAARAHGAAGTAGPWIARELLPALLGARAGAGTVVALGDGSEDFDLGTVTAELHEESGGLRLEGRKRLVVGAVDAERALLAARNAGTVVLVEVALDTPGVTHTPRRTIGREGEADLDFDRVRLGDDAVVEELTPGQLDEVGTIVALGLAGAALGSLGRLLELSLARGHARRQFGRPVGTFQAFQHACAEMAMERELAARLVERAAATATRRDALRARAFTGAAATRAAARALQLQGGQGFLDANPVSRLYRAAKTSEARWISVSAALEG